MTFIELGLITCFIGFLASSVLCAKSIYSKSATNAKAILLVSVLSFGVLLTSELKSYKNEIGFLTVFAVEAIHRILTHFGL